MKIKAVIFHHNQPDNADELYERLSPVIDTELWDSGSPPNRIPRHVTHPFPNFYGTGAWNHMMKHYSDFDAVWLICGDVKLLSEPEEYLQAMESALPFGCWSPCIEGRAHPFMLAEHYGSRKPFTVKNVESQAMALSGPLMKQVKQLIDGSPYGFGHDYWLCHRSRKAGMRNIIDGRVRVFHPPGTGYNEQKAHDMMDEAFGSKYGPNYRQTIFEYSPTFEGNLLGQYQPVTQPKKERAEIMPLTIFTVDNGWGYQEFVDIVRAFPACKKLLMKKGVSQIVSTEVEVIPYNPDLSGFADGNYVGLFPRLGPANFEDYKSLLALGVPCVVNVAYQRDTIKHEVTGFVYGNNTWAEAWLRALLSDDKLRQAIHDNLLKTPAVPAAPVSVAPVKAPLVTVITPTCRREPKVVRRCINCLQLQTVTDWQQLLCSSGELEQPIEELLRGLSEPRVQYACVPKSGKQGDFGNTVRHEMLKRATGKYILFCDDDNVIQPDYLEKMVKKLEASPEADFVVCRIVHFGPLNEAVSGKPPKILTGFPVKLYHVDPLQILVKRDAMQDVGWDCDHGYVSDGVTLEALGNKYKAVELPEVLGFHM